jgi:Zn-finger domain-containing protein
MRKIEYSEFSKKNEEELESSPGYKTCGYCEYEELEIKIHGF